jgi:hypothetical protein
LYSPGSLATGRTVQLPFHIVHDGFQHGLAVALGCEVYIAFVVIPEKAVTAFYQFMVEDWWARPTDVGPAFRLGYLHALEWLGTVDPRQHMRFHLCPLLFSGRLVFYPSRAHSVLR